MKKLFTVFILSFLLMSCGVSKTTTTSTPPIKGKMGAAIIAKIDIANVVDDKVKVTINPGKIEKHVITYRLPKVIPGTYAVSDFGKYIENFKALDFKGKELKVIKTDVNSWQIDNAYNLDKITYLVNDTFDNELEVKENKIFSPSGTNIHEDIYVLNLFGFVGYFESLKNKQYKLDVIAPVGLTRSSALNKMTQKTSKDGKTITTSYYAPRYFDITDNPMMYGNLEVAEFQIGDIKIVLSLYSPNKKHTVKQIGETMQKMMLAQKKYLGDINSTPRYDIFVYLADQKATEPTGFGALEHHRSTTVVMPEAMPAEALSKSLVDIVSHEFFHIVAPLSVHSEDVHYFDFHNPTFSKHLWLYEGVTEYFATLFQVNQGLVEQEEFTNKIIDKIQSAASMNDAMSFTKMSENILDQPYKAQYGNVYLKGALIGMCIDILLREESNGQRGILSLMKELSLKYGVNKPFEDDKLIDEIVAMTYPSLRTFFDKHVIGNTPIDYNEFFKKVGLEVTQSKVKTNYIQNAGALIVSGDPNKGIFFTDLVAQNSFWQEAGAKSGDIIKEVNGEKVTLQNANKILGQVFSWKPGQDVVVKLDRNGQEIIINKALTQSYTMGKSLKVTPNQTAKQKLVFDSWLKG